MSIALKLVNGIPRSVTVSATSSFYDETVTVPNGGYTPGTVVTLPSSMTYTDIELLVFLDGQLLEVGDDYTYVGTAPRTQIQIIPELFENEKLRFRIQS